MLGEARFVDIGDRTLYARVSGHGPAVVLNSGGGREGVGTWLTIESQVSEFATTVVYDRAGLGHSPPPPAAPTALDMAGDLRALLAALQLSPPVVLVGWSLSALMVQLYACEYPEDVSGLLLLDPTPDESLAGILNHRPTVQGAMRAAMLGNARQFGMSDAGIVEMERLFESCEQARHAVVDNKRMPDVDVVVITASIPTAVGDGAGTANLGQAHKRIVEWVPRGRHLFAQRSFHRTMISDEPELIIGAIRSVLDGAKGRKS